MTAPVAGIAEGFSLRIGEFKKPFISALRNQRCVVEFMPAHRGAGPPERAVSNKPDLAVAEVQPARRETGRMAEQADHGVAHPVRILEALAEHHVAAAFTVNRTSLAKLPQTALEMISVCQHARVKLRIAAGKPTGVAVMRRRFICQRRE